MRGCLRLQPAIVAVDDAGRPLPLAHSVLGGALASDVTAGFDLGEVLGRGAFATTRACVERATGRRLACKSVLKRRLLIVAPDLADVRREVQIMHHLSGHPNVPWLVGAYEDAAYVHLVMELAEGGSLLDRVMERGAYPERDAAAIVGALLDAIAFAHDMGCAHRDIKLDNLLMADSSDSAAAVRLVDWGFAAFTRPGRKLHGLCGTSYYIAPEVLNGFYDERADVWSAGVVLYILLCGRPPFGAGSPSALFRRIVDDGVPDMVEDPWPLVSEAAKDAVRKLLTWHPHRRPTARQALRHEFFCAVAPASASACGSGAAPAPGAPLFVHAELDPEPEPEVLRRMRGFASFGRLKQLAALVVASQLPCDCVRGLAELFASMDANRDGRLTLDELRVGLEAHRCRVHASELTQLMAMADINGDGELDYAEFLATTLHSSRLEEEANMLLAFRHFDRDGDGRISPEELRYALAAAGDPVSAREAADIIASADRDRDGEIDYDEFVALIRDSSGPDGTSSRSPMGLKSTSSSSSFEGSGADTSSGGGGSSSSCNHPDGETPGELSGDSPSPAQSLGRSDAHPLWHRTAGRKREPLWCGGY